MKMKTIIRFASLFVVITILLSGCFKDERPKFVPSPELETEIDKLGNNIDILQNIIKTLQSNVYISSFVESPDNREYTIGFTDNSSITIYCNEIKSESSPAIEAREDNGVYYWTLNGNWLTDASSNKIPVIGPGQALPIISVNDKGHWIFSVNGTSINIGRANNLPGNTGQREGNSIFSAVTEKTDCIDIKLINGVIISLLKYNLSISFEDTEELLLLPNKTYNIPYSVTCADNNTIVDVTASSEFTARVIKTDFASGKIEIITSGTVTSGQVSVSVLGSQGSNIVSTINVLQGIITITGSSHLVEPFGGSIPVGLSTNLNYTVKIPTPDQSWISGSVSSRAVVRNETLTLTIQPNKNSTSRSSVIELVDKLGVTVKEISIEQRASTGLATLFINTNNRSITSKDVWLTNASYSILDKDGVEIASGATDIKGRGNSTWGMPKKPYSLKLTQKAPILNMPTHKRWTLLANYSDKTLLRTETAFKMGAIFDNLLWTPRSQQIDFFLNDTYSGTYQLTEAIKVDENRVNLSQTISKKNPNGGYLLEIDERRGEIFNFNTSRGVVFCCSDPDDGLDDIITGGTGTLFQKIKTDVQNLENAIYSASFSDPTNGYRKYIDVNSFVDWYLVNEITKNNDAIFYLSVYMYYNPDSQKFFLGPIWDFDISLGNIDYSNCSDPVGFWIKDSKWIIQLFKDPYFVSLVKARWNEKKQELAELTTFIQNRATALENSQRRNFEKWNILNQYVWPNKIVTGSYQGEVDYLKDFLSKRITWLDTAINAL